jgi:low affinity Fe/Cu permease
MFGRGFSIFASRTASIAGRPITFAVAVGSVILWAVLGPVFGFSDAWQLTINTATTIITFLMVFLIQNSQNRDSRAVQIKLDELIRATLGAHNALLNLEELSEEELEGFRKCYIEIAEKAREEGLIDEEGRLAIVLPGDGKAVLVENAKRRHRNAGRRKR